MREAINSFPGKLKKRRNVDEAEMEARLLQMLGMLQEKRAAITCRLLERVKNYSYAKVLFS